MLDSTEYAMAWGVYLLGVAGALAVWWRLTRPLPLAPLRHLLRVMVAAPLLIPAPVAAGMDPWAPALFVLLWDATLVEAGDPARSLPYLIYALVLGLLVVLADYLWQRDRKSVV